MSDNLDEATTVIWWCILCIYTTG